MNRTLAVLVGDIQNPKWHQNALKLVHPLLKDFDANISYFSDLRMAERGFNFCFHLLRDDSATMHDAFIDEDRSSAIALLIRLIARTPPLYASAPFPHTPAQFDMLTDYHLYICENTLHSRVRFTFWLLEWLGGSPSIEDRTRRYIDTMIYFMGRNIIHVPHYRKNSHSNSVLHTPVN
jgi:hypothetical protein